ncbi:MAG: acetate/propionate family kinase [Gemmataceae bacterium]|nr:acetate/propionate family kinase [Gemmataceae bacterium]
MFVLVANLGSTSFKYRLFDMTSEKLLARGAVERIGSPISKATAQVGEQRQEREIHAPDHAVAVTLCLQQLVEMGALPSADQLAAIGFKAVHADGVSGVQLVTEEVLRAMEAFSDVAPAHNPPYIAAMRLLARELPHIPLVAAFETGFHETIPPENRFYAVPQEWYHQYGIRRWGFHGASHRYIAGRTAELLNNPAAKIISCHLGGSSSLCAIHNGKSLANSLGMSPQTGLPHNNRVGDFDPFALPVLMRRTGRSLEEILKDLASRSGLLGLCGSNDLRDIEARATNGDESAKLAIDVFVAAIRHYLGAYLLMMNGADAIVFTGGIGENSALIRSLVCRNLDWFGIYLDEEKNNTMRGEGTIHQPTSRVALWIMPTNEEIIVARQAADILSKRGVP